MAELRMPGTLLILVSALVLGGSMALGHAGAWPCVDDPITLWAALGTDSASGVIDRSTLTAHLPTFFWLVRLADRIGGEHGREIAVKAIPWVGSIVAQYLIASRLTQSRSAGAAAAGLTAALPHFVDSGLCLRPYAWGAFLVSLAVLGLTDVLGERPLRGATLATVASALIPHASLSAIPLAAATCAVVDAALWNRRRGRALVVVFLGVQLGAALPVAAKASTLLHAPSYHAWMSGAPVMPQLGYPALLALAGAIGLGLPGRPALRGTVRLVAALALIHPCAILLYYWVSGESLFAPRYHVPDAVFASLLTGVIIGGIGSVPARPVCAALFVLVAAATSEGLLRSAGRNLRPFRERTPELRYAGAHATTSDVIVVSSPYAESEHWRYYEDDLHRSYLLAETLRVAELAERSLFPAPPGETLPSACWLASLERRLDASSRIWFVRRVHWSTLWTREEGTRESAALRALRRIGFMPVANAVPAEHASQLILLERSAVGSPPASGSENECAS